MFKCVSSSSTLTVVTYWITNINVILNFSLHFFFSENVAGYSQMFDIIALEVYWYSGKVDSNLEKNLKTFLNEGQYLQNWSKVCYS